MALDDSSASSAPPAPLPLPPSTISSSRTDSEISSSGGAAHVDGSGIGGGGSEGAEGKGEMGVKVSCLKSATLKRPEQQQSDLEKGVTKGERNGLRAGLEPSSSLPLSSSSSRRFRLWGRRKARSWPTVLSNDEEGGKREGGWGERGGEAKEGEGAGKEGREWPQGPPSISVLSSLQSSMQSFVWRIEARLHQVSSGEREGGFRKAERAESKKEAALRRPSPMGGGGIARRRGIRIKCFVIHIFIQFTPFSQSARTSRCPNGNIE